MFLYSVHNWTCSWLAYSLMQEITCLAWRGKLWNCQGKLQQTVQANGPCVLNNKRYLNRGVENCARSVLVREHQSRSLENSKRYLNRGVENWIKSKSETSDLEEDVQAAALWKSQPSSLRKCRTWSLGFDCLGSWTWSSEETSGNCESSSSTSRFLNSWQTFELATITGKLLPLNLFSTCKYQAWQLQSSLPIWTTNFHISKQ